ncbi:MAG TPA: trypsin-like peptidase domain-containing protein [Steroidobacteraceae bacterium]|nr:trypsin-like peptidase domain-containing protein [Steroidobacteraceae bacterium]
MKSSRPLLFGVLLGALAAGLVAVMRLGWGAAPVVDRTVTPRGELDADEKATIALFEHARESVVYISTSELVRDFWSRDVQKVPQGTGSGFIWDDAGDVVTNLHVIADASGGATVRLADGRDYPATLVGYSELHDIAVLRINVDFKRPKPVPIGTSGDLKVGQKVFAIGNPFGLDWTLTTGIVSALDRSQPTEDGQGIIEHLIQTDAAINPGNSGGPLLDSAGRLVGINASIYSPSGASAGIGFAIPVDTVMRVVPQLIHNGRYTRPSLGIQTDEDINERVSQVLGVKGVAVLRVARGSAAAQAGLQALQVSRRGEIVAGDIITAVNGVAVESVAHLDSRLDDFAVGATVTLDVWRQGKKLKVSAKLQAER